MESEQDLQAVRTFLLSQEEELPSYRLKFIIGGHELTRERVNQVIPVVEPIYDIRRIHKMEEDFSRAPMASFALTDTITSFTYLLQSENPQLVVLPVSKSSPVVVGVALACKYEGVSMAALQVTNPGDLGEDLTLFLVEHVAKTISSWQDLVRILPP
jgi:hypothetical protein